MTPIILLDQFKLFTEFSTKDIILPTRGKPGEKTEHRAPEVWRMRLPDREAETKKAPYILLQLVNGTDEQESGEQPESQCNIRAIVCVCSEDASEGALNVLNIITRLRTDLLKRRVIGRQFTLRMPLEYLVYLDDTAPYFMGEMMTGWEMPIIKREVPELWQNQMQAIPDRPGL